MDNDIKKFAELVKKIDFAMFTTIGENGKLYSRPMSTQSVEFDGDLWFMSDSDSEKIKQIKVNSNVNVSYTDKSNDTFISVIGTAEILTDKNKIEELWSPALRIWWEGPNDSKICLIKVKVDKAEYWDSPKNQVVSMVNFIRSIVTGSDKTETENKVIDF